MNDYDKNTEILDDIFFEDFSEWMMYRLPEYLDNRFDRWMINPLDKNQVEIFIEPEESMFEITMEEQMFDEAMYIALDLLDASGVVDENGYLIEQLPSYVLESLYLHPISELGDEPLADDDNLLFSSDFFE